MIKGIVFDIKRYAVHDGPGIRTTVFLKGCAATCWWCHNPESQDPGIEKTIRINRFDDQAIEEEETIGQEFTVDQVMTEIRKDHVFYEESKGGATFSGGEPLLQPQFLSALLSECQREGLHTTLDTTGYAPQEIFTKISDHVDLFLYDIKFIDDRLHHKYTGVSNESILNNLTTIIEQKRPIRLRFPVIPKITDTKKNIDEIMNFILNLQHGGIDIDLLPYHKIARHKYDKLNKNYLMGDIAKPSLESIADLQAKFEQAGFKVQIGG